LPASGEYLKTLVWIPPSSDENPSESYPTPAQAEVLAPALLRLTALDIQSTFPTSLNFHLTHLSPIFFYLSNIERLHIGVDDPTPSEVQTADALIRSLPKLRELSLNCFAAPWKESRRHMQGAFEDVPSLEVLYWTWLVRTEEVFRRLRYDRDGWSSKEIELDPVRRRASDSIFSLTDAVVVPV
jgi:hypothetical protein